jgi:hypothetical protein
MKAILRSLIIIFTVGLSDMAHAQINLPYFQDFEAGNGGWTDASIDTLTRWEYGTPNFSPTNTAHSGIYCWDISLDSSYSNNANATLTSPVINTGPGSIKVFAL